jgi:hypothetical protein
VHFEAEIPLISPNRLRAEHWRSRAWRVKCERAEMARAILEAGVTAPPGPWTVRIVRLAARELDAHDNLPLSAKGIVDEIARWLGLKCDEDPQVTWSYAQEKRLEPARELRTPTGRKKAPKTMHRVWVRVEVGTRVGPANDLPAPKEPAPPRTAGLERVCAKCSAPLGRHRLVGKLVTCP